MKKSIFCLLVVLSLAACGSGEKAATSDAALKKQADVAKATLQQKADAMAREASMLPPPPAEKKK